MLCPRCGFSNGAGAQFCAACGTGLGSGAYTTTTPAPAAPAAVPATAPTASVPVAAYPAPVQEPPYRGYWRALLLWGVILAVVGWIFVYNGMHSAANDISNSFSSNDYTDSGNDGGEILFGGALVAIGSLMWLPGVIGWGIHASGLTRPRTAAAPQRFDRTYAPPLNLTSSGQ